MMKSLAVAGLVTVALMVSACGKPDGAVIEPQYWENNQVTLEARPYPLRLGMNEFIVLVTAPGLLPVHDVLVEMRAEGQKKWGQGIQDGATGVFRKALRIDRIGQQWIHVSLKRDGVTTIVRFQVETVD